MKLVLTREIDDGIRTLGWLDVGDQKFATVERPWVENTTGPGGMPRQSCVPKGTYVVEPWTSEKFPGTYIISCPSLGVYRQPKDIPKEHSWGRSAVLIHIGNTVDDVVGCIAIGISRIPHGVAKSAIALQTLRHALGRTATHELVIR